MEKSKKKKELDVGILAELVQNTLFLATHMGDVTWAAIVLYLYHVQYRRNFEFTIP